MCCCMIGSVVCVHSHTMHQLEQLGDHMCSSTCVLLVPGPVLLQQLQPNNADVLCSYRLRLDAAHYLHGLLPCKGTCLHFRTDCPAAQDVIWLCHRLDCLPVSKVLPWQQGLLCQAMNVLCTLISIEPGGQLLPAALVLPSLIVQ
jgi:hypothetical protein